MNKLKRIILTLALAITLAFSSPLAVLAGEAAPAPEASGGAEAGSAQEAVSAPGAAPVIAPSPAPEQTTTTFVESVSQSQQEGYDWDQYDEDVDEDDLNIDGDEWVSTGENRSGNVGDTSIDTGDATANGTVVNSANQTSVSSPCTVCVDDVSVKNSGNGANSSNGASVDVDSDSTVVVNNDADVDNNLVLSADSGSNAASYNVGDSQIETGDANVSGVVITSANETGLGIVEYNIIDDHMGDIILDLPDGLFGCGLCGPSGDINAQNTANGADSTNTVGIDLDNTTNTTVNNDADIVNNLDLLANSGANQTSYNTGGDSSITTGDANVSASLLNFVNSTISGGAAFIVNVFGDLVGDIIFPDSLPGIGGTALSAANTGNGANSTNTIEVDSTNESNTTLDNFADIDNILNIDATTGGNLTSYNTGGDNSIETGDVFVNAEVMNIVNTNLLTSSDEPLWLILVNNMGSWTGSIIGALTGTNYSGSEGFVFNVDENGEIVAANQGNGAGSVNDIGIVQNNTNDLTVNNTANVTNNININANTGGNSASYNTGGDSRIETGDVNVAASILNFVNTNLIGRTLMLGVINVFGSWTGDAVPPGHDPAADGASASSSQPLGGSSGGSSGSGGGGLSAGISGAIINALVQNNSSGSSSPTGFGLFGGSGGSGGGTSGDNESTVTVEGNAPSVLGDGASEEDGMFSLTFNWKILLLSLIPLIAFALFRARSLNRLQKQQPAIAHEIKVKKKK